MAEQGAGGSPHEDEKVEKRRPFRRWLRRGGLFVTLLLALLLIGAGVLLNNKNFQNWLTDRLTRDLSEKLHTTVSIERVEVDLLSRVHISGFYLEGLDCDTLLYADQLDLQLARNPLTLIRKKLAVRDITLRKALFRLKKWGPGQNNLTELLRPLQKPFPDPDRKKESSFALELDLKTLWLEQVRFEEQHLEKGNFLTLGIDKGKLKVDRLDLANNLFTFKKIIIDQPLVVVEERPPGQASVDAQPEISLPRIDVESPLPDSLRKPFRLLSDKVVFKDGTVIFDSYRRAPQRNTPPDQVDYDHLYVEEVGIDVDCFAMSDLNFEGQIRRITFRERSGFELESLSARQASVTPQGIKLYGMDLETPFSNIGDTLEFKYREYWDFTSFEDKVRMYGKFKDAEVGLQDIIAFAPPLESNAFFTRNEDQKLFFSGLISGTVNRLRGQELDIKLGKNIDIRGKISITNVTQRDNEFVSLQLKELKTDIPTLRQIIPGFDPPPQFNQLGKMRFSGNFDGFFLDFVADGTLQTDLGRATMDMRLDLKPGKENARYSGQMSMMEFHLGALAQSPDLGRITFSAEVRDGIGLTDERAYADLMARIEHLDFKGYDYKYIVMNGALEKNSFRGKLNITDQNIDLSFNGLIVDLDSFNLQADVRKLHLKQLNLAEKDLVLSGALSMNLKGNSLFDIQGVADITDFKLADGPDTFKVASLQARSVVGRDSFKRFEIDSDVLRGSLWGYFDLPEIPNALLTFLKKSQPEFFKTLALRQPGGPVPEMDFHFDLLVPNSKNFTYLLTNQLLTLVDTRVSGYFSSSQDSLDLQARIPSMQLGENNWAGIQLQANAQGPAFNLDSLVVKSIQLGERSQPLSIRTYGDLERDTLFFDLQAQGPNKTFQFAAVKGKMFRLEDAYKLIFAPSDLVLINENWQIPEGNALVIGDRYLQTEAFQLVNLKRNRRIMIDSKDGRSLNLFIDNLDFALIDELWDYDELDFKGSFQVKGHAADLFELKGLRLDLVSDSLFVNGDDWGTFQMTADLPALDQPLTAYGQITSIDKASQLILEGKHLLPTANNSGNSHYFDFALSLGNYPLAYAEYFIGDLISQSEGKVDASLRFFGPPEKPNIEGNVTARKLSTKVNYLQTTYFIDKADIAVSNEMFDFSGAKVRDEKNNTGTLTGGIVHQNLKDFGLDIQLSAPRFLCLNTDKYDNTYFYGYGMAEDLYLKFDGSFQQTNLRVIASSGEGSTISIPVSDTRNASETSFIKFTSPSVAIDSASLLQPGPLKGLNIDMDLFVDPRAEIAIIFDEQSGDIIRGNGRGNLQFQITRTGDFIMYGDYIINEGEYLFTWYDLVNKPFIINQAKQNWIRWSGDPFDAQIRINAEYKNLSTSLTTFLAEYLIDNPQVEQAARRSVPVELTMLLEGSLLRPDISFDLRIPNAPRELNSYLDSKLRILKRDQNELNRQVFGLIVMGTFLPSQGLLQGRDGSRTVNPLNTTGINTISELLSNQLSLYLTELLSELVSDVGFISGVDFDIAYNRYETGFDNLARAGNEVQVRLRPSIINDRILFSIGGNYAEGDGTAQYIAHDFALEIVLTEDRRYKFKFYDRTEPEVTGALQRKTGIGLVYRREFDNFRELLFHLDEAKREFKKR